MSWAITTDLSAESPIDLGADGAGDEGDLAFEQSYPRFDPFPRCCAAGAATRESVSVEPSQQALDQRLDDLVRGHIPEAALGGRAPICSSATPPAR